MIEIHFLFLLLPALVLFLWIEDLHKRTSAVREKLKKTEEELSSLQIDFSDMVAEKNKTAEFNGKILSAYVTFKKQAEHCGKDLGACRKQLHEAEHLAEQLKSAAKEQEKYKTSLAIRAQDALQAPEKLDEVQQQVFEKLKYSRRNIFIQGQAGTGKSALVAYLKKNLAKKIILTAPTGIAAQNIGGSTLHSVFLLPPADFFYPSKAYLEPRVEALLQHAELLIIDEISMVRPDLLDTIELLARRSRDSEEVFGGLQVLLIGDLLQLPPVIKKREVKEKMQRFYGYALPYFFDTPAYKNGNFSKFYLEKIYRQSDAELKKYLCFLRNNECVDEVLHYFNADIIDATLHDDVITITPYNAHAYSINIQQLKKNPAPLEAYTCRMSGTYAASDKKDYPAPKRLFLKVGARVIFTRNIAPDCTNGTQGTIVAMESDTLWVKLANGKEYPVQRYEWLDTSYCYNAETRSLEEKIEGTFCQFPVLLGYALTVHKAQGKTLDKACFDKGQKVFAHGQLYVALSRTRTKADLYIARELVHDDVKYDERVMSFLRDDK